MHSNLLNPAPEAFLAVLDGLVAIQKSRAQLDALELALFAAASDYADRSGAAGAHDAEFGRDISTRSTAMELGAALRISDRTALGNMSNATFVCEQYPDVWAALSRGEISRSHVRAITDAGQCLSHDAARAEYSARVLPIAGSETAARTRSIARVIATRIEPEVIEARVQAAVCQRRVQVIDLEDGLSAVTATLPSVLAHGIHDRLTQTANAITAAERMSDAPSRRIDEVRADLFADLLLTGTPSASQAPALARDGIDLGALRGHVQVIVTSEALLGDEKSVAVVPGAGPIPIDQARVIAGHTPTWDRITIDPTTRTMLSVDTYRPTAAQRRFLTAFDEHCRQPGCRRPAMTCDVDHSHDAARGGKTDVANLGNLCPSHHTVKHADKWTLHRAPDGTIRWQSKHGRTYPDIARPAVAFMVAAPAPDDPPPF